MSLCCCSLQTCLDFSLYKVIVRISASISAHHMLSPHRPGCLNKPSSPPFDFLHHTITSVSQKSRVSASWQVTKTLLHHGDVRKTRIVIRKLGCVRVFRVFSLHFNHQKSAYDLTMINSTIFPWNFSTTSICLESKKPLP